VKTYAYPNVTLTSYTGGGESSKPALSPFGPVRAGLTTSQITNEARLTELLNSLESVVASLISKSSTALDTLTTATKEMLAEPLPSTIDTGGTNDITW
jgi:hypothetical protein